MSTVGSRGVGLVAIVIALASTFAAVGVPRATSQMDSFDLGLELVADGFERPIYLADAGDGSGRLFVVEQEGRVLIVRDGRRVEQPFLDIVDLVGCCGERGLLSIAFHPDYDANGHFFVDYTDRNGDTVVARYAVSPDDPDRADPASAQTILFVEDPAGNHNGGLLLFGPDGYLYIGFGDGGGGNARNGQLMDTLWGKLLRIDVDHAEGDRAYAIPPDNPFVDDPAVHPEIWASGLRNPWRFSFDRETGDLYIGDVGSGTFEEISFQPADSPGGENYGWNLMEGSDCRAEGGDCSSLGLVPPIAEYRHGAGDCVVTGGYVYRGAAVPSLIGVYVYGDYCSGRIWGLTRDTVGTWLTAGPIETDLRISSFGEDAVGELYVVDIQGSVYRIV